jgi:hypothetical protein
LRIVPGTVTPIDELGLIDVPGAKFNQRVDPLVQVAAADVGPDVTDLLLSGAPHCLDIVEMFFNGPARRYCFQYLTCLDLRVRAEVGNPATISELDQHNTNHAGCEFGRREEGLMIY